MKQVIWKTIFSTPGPAADPAPALWFGSGEDRSPLKIVRNAQARRMSLRLDRKDGSVRLVLPVRAPLAPALAWAETKRDWIERQMANRPQGQGIAPGMLIPFGDAVLQLVWDPDLPRTPRRSGDVLQIGGPKAGLAGRVIRWLKSEALTLFDQETRAMAAQINRSVVRVALGDPVSRWGSCSSHGVIRYSWRLIMAPAHVQQMIVAHEVAHLVHMNHSAAFHAQARALAGTDPKAANRWLKDHAARLHGFGRES